MADKAVVGISACLVGEKVRYDGGDKHHQLIAEIVAPKVKLIPFCPEAEAGLGIPRPPIQLTETESGIRALGVDESSLDPTDKLVAIAAEFTETLQQLDAYIFKSRSPSCGVEQVPVDVEGQIVEKGRGLFAERLIAVYPDLLVIEEKDLLTEADCCHFLEKIRERRASA